MTRAGDGTQRPRGANGFTLLEILAAVAIGAFLIVAVYGILVETLQVSRLTEDAADLEREGQAILDLMVADLEALPRFLMSTQAGRFSGRRDGDLPRLDFITGRDSLTTASRVASDITEVGYVLKRRNDGSDLHELYRREEFFVDDAPLTGGTLTRLSNRVKSFDLAYRGGSPEDVWTDVWTNLGSGAAPTAVRIQLVLARPKPGDDGGDAIEERTFRTTVLTPP